MCRFSSAVVIVGITLRLLAQAPSPDAKQPEEAKRALCNVRGRVVAAADGNPLNSARITLIPEGDHSHKQIYSASSDKDGHFSLKDVPAGRYQFFAAHTGFVDQHFKAGTGDSKPLFSLSPGEKVSDVLFRLIAAAAITGRISNEDGEPMERVQVVALRRPSEDELEDASDYPRGHHKIQMQAVSGAGSDDRGQYRIFGLKPGEYFVRVDDSFMPPNWRIPVDETAWAKMSLGSEYASVYFPGVIQSSQAQVIPVKAGEEAQADITMRRVKTVEISGRLIGPTGPATSALIRLAPADDSESDFDRQDTTDEKGGFHFRNVPQGSYYIYAYQRQETREVYESTARQKVEVGEDNIDALTVTLTPGVTFRGKIKTGSSGSVDFDRLSLSLASVDESEVPGGHAEVKNDGTFEFRSVHDGDYAVQLWGLKEGTCLKSARIRSDDLLEKGLQVEGNSAGQIELTVATDCAKLEGSVSDDDGPMVGARVRLIPDPRTRYNNLRIQRTNTDQRGHFLINSIAPGKYTVTAKPSASSETGGYEPATQSITFSENDHQTLDIKLEKQTE
jgi:hypothetical protein